MAVKSGKNGGTSGVEEEEVKATEAPKAEVTKAAEPPKPDATPEDESTYTSQMMFGQKTYDQQMKDEKHFAGLNRTDEISQLGGASKLEVDLAQMKIFSTDRIGDDLYAAIQRGDTHKVEAMAGLNSDRRMTEAQILVLLKAKREHDDDVAKKIALDAYYTQELEDKKKHAEDEATFYDKRADDQNARTASSGSPNEYSNSEPNFENAGWDDEGNYHDRYGSRIDQDGNVTMADGTHLSASGIVTHTNGDMETVHGDRISAATADQIDFVGPDGKVETSLHVDEIVTKPPAGEPELTEDGKKQLLFNSLEKYLQTPEGGGLSLELAKERAANASEADLAAQAQRNAAAAAAPQTHTGDVMVASPSAASGSSGGAYMPASERAASIFERYGIKPPEDRGTPEQRKEGVSYQAQVLQSAPGYNRWANAEGKKFREAMEKWEKDSEAARIAGQPEPDKPTRTPLEKYWEELDRKHPGLSAKFKAAHAEADKLDDQVLTARQEASRVSVSGGTTRPVLGDGTDPNADPAIAKPVDVDMSGATFEDDKIDSGYYDEFGGYYDESGGYDDGMGNYYAADGGFYDNKGGYTWPDGAYIDKFKNYVSPTGDLTTSSGVVYKKADYPDADFKGLLTTNAWKEDRPDPFRKEIPPAQAFDSFIKGKVWDPSEHRAKFDPDKPISLFSKEDGSLTYQNTGNLWDPLSTSPVFTFGPDQKLTTTWLNSPSLLNKGTPS